MQLRLERVAVAVMLWLAPGRAIAGYPFETDDTGTEAAAGASIEYSAGVDLAADGEAIPAGAGGVGVQVGLLDSLALGMTFSVGVESAWPAVSGPDFGLKWRMLGEPTGPSLGLRIDYGIGGEAGAVALLSFVNEQVAVHLDIGASADLTSTQRAGELWAGMTAQSVVASDVSLGIELCVSTSSDGAEQGARLALGGSWGFADRLTLGYGAWGVAASDSALGFGLGLALTATALP